MYSRAWYSHVLSTWIFSIIKIKKKSPSLPYLHLFASLLFICQLTHTSETWIFSIIKIKNKSPSLPYLHLFSSLSLTCQLTHKTLMHCPHLPLWLAAVLADTHLFHPTITAPALGAFDRPTFLHPPGCRITAAVHIVVFSILRTWLSSSIPWSWQNIMEIRF